MSRRPSESSYADRKPSRDQESGIPESSRRSSTTSQNSQDQDSLSSADAHNVSRTANLIKAIIDLEMQDQFVPKQHLGDLNALPVKQYLDATVIPVLIQALEYLATARPPEPINALCVYLLKYRDKYERKHHKNAGNDKT